MSPKHWFLLSASLATLALATNPVAAQMKMGNRCQFNASAQMNIQTSGGGGNRQLQIPKPMQPNLGANVNRNAGGPGIGPGMQLNTQRSLTISTMRPQLTVSRTPTTNTSYQIHRTSSMVRVPTLSITSRTSSVALSP